VEKYTGNFCCKPRFFTSFRVVVVDDDDDDDEIDISQINAVRVLPAYYFKIHFNLI